MFESISGIYDYKIDVLVNLLQADYTIKVLGGCN